LITTGIQCFRIIVDPYVNYNFITGKLMFKATYITACTSILPNVSQHEESGFELTPGGPVSPEKSRNISLPGMLLPTPAVQTTLVIYYI